MSRKKIAQWVRAYRTYGLSNKSIKRHLRCMKEV